MILYYGDDDVDVNTDNNSDSLKDGTEYVILSAEIKDSTRLRFRRRDNTHEDNINSTQTLEFADSLSLFADYNNNGTGTAYQYPIGGSTTQKTYL